MFSCTKESIKEDVINNESFRLVVGYDGNVPIYQKLISNNTNKLKYIDSIKKDSMFLFENDVLIRKGLWKYAENKQIIPSQWTLIMNEKSNISELVEYGNIFDPETQFINRNQQYYFVNNKIDSSNSFFYILKQLDNGDFSLFLKSRDEKELFKLSFLSGEFSGEKSATIIHLNEGRNLISETGFNLIDGERYDIMTFYIKNEEDSIDFEKNNIMQIQLSVKENNLNNLIVDSLKLSQTR